MPLGRRITLGGARAQCQHFMRVHSQIESTTRGMGLLMEAKQKQFLLQTKAVDGDETWSGNAVDTEKDDTQQALPLAKVDKVNKLEDEVEERSQKKRKLKRVAISETIDHCAGICVRRSVSTKLRSANVRACSKIKAKQLLIEEEDSTNCSEAASQGRITPAEWVELEAKVACTKEGPFEKEVWPSE
ncbi:hypothetical protein AXG93_3086s1030 [Marchantia polymorpha subsp. ruderalis]|uniref:Uncharacterized protein n=1 Tax=Marchantia polymorpha subsp. ruderalis TaxID=1480154 RepID=A0A176VY20_MARPO|nr:hypothetical protein AXG93_3086s1030 [Marchantia polymorpha subsp. ruderalis]